MANPEDYGSIGVIIRKGDGDDIGKTEKINLDEPVAVFEHQTTPDVRDKQKMAEREDVSPDTDIIDDPMLPGDRTMLIMKPGDKIPISTRELAGGFDSVRELGHCRLRKITDADKAEFARKQGKVGGTLSFAEHLPKGHPNRRVMVQDVAKDGSGSEAGLGFPDDKELQAAAAGAENP